ncbi:MAG: ABC transporter permease, partial [Oscillospiraceae bacterium]|nr:ABC transporter permease [Oscillospiraceae bacterium]
MTKSLFRDTLRAIRKTLSRFISIVIIVALGVGFFAGLKAVSPNMKGAADAFYSQLNLADLVLTSTVGFDAQDVEAMLAIEGIESVTPSRYVDGLVYNEDGQLAQSLTGTAYVLRVIGYDFTQLAGSGSERLNQLELVQGRVPEAPNECVASVYESDVNLQDEIRDRYKIGNTLTIKGDHEDLLDSIKTTEFTVVGLVHTPEFVSMELGSSQAGGGELCGYIYIPDDAFTIDYYTKLYLGIAGSDSREAYSESYDEGVRQWKDALVDEYSAPIVASRAERMGATIAEQAYAERKKIGQFLQQATALLPLLSGEDKTTMNALLEQLYRLQTSAQEGTDAQADVARQIGDGKQELALARQLLPLGQKALAEGPKEYNRTKAEKEKEISAGEAKLEKGRLELEKQKALYNTQLAEYNKGVVEFEAAKKIVLEHPYAEEEYVTAKNQLEQAQSSYEIASAAVKAGRSALSTAKKALASEQADRIANAMAILQGYFPLEDESLTVEGLRRQVEEAEEQLNLQEEELAEGKEKIDDGKKRLAEAEPLMAQLEE